MRILKVLSTALALALSTQALSVGRFKRRYPDYIIAAQVLEKIAPRP